MVAEMRKSSVRPSHANDPISNAVTSNFRQESDHPTAAVKMLPHSSTSRHSDIMSQPKKSFSFKANNSVKVIFLDDSMSVFQVQIKSVGRVLFDEVCKQLNLLEADYFGLEYQGMDNVWYWLDLEKPVNRQISLSLSDMKMKFCVKFYTPDPSQLLEEYTRYLFCMNIKKDLSQGLLHCNENTAALIASYIVQSECGDFASDEYPDHTYLSSYKFIPNQTENFQIKIMQNHKKHVGQSPAEADLNVLETARKCELYGIKMHPAKDCEGVILNLSVAHLGILVFQSLTKINTFSWAKIRKISFKRKRFLIKFHTKEYGYYKDVVEFFFDSRNECKNFWKKCVENHSFYRCPFVKHVPRQRKRVLSRGSSFRYSGKTQKEVTDFVKENYVDRHSFVRSTSIRRSAAAALSHSNSVNVCEKAFGSSVAANPMIPLIDADDATEVNHLDLNSNEIIMSSKIARADLPVTNEEVTIEHGGVAGSIEKWQPTTVTVGEREQETQPRAYTVGDKSTIVVEAAVHDLRKPENESLQSGLNFCSPRTLNDSKQIIYYHYDNVHNSNLMRSKLKGKERESLKIKSDPNLRRKVANENMEYETSLQFAYSTLQFVSHSNSCSGTPKEVREERRAESCRAIFDDFRSRSPENGCFGGLRLESPVTRYENGSYRSLCSNYSSANRSLEIEQDIIVPTATTFMSATLSRMHASSCPNSLQSNGDFSGSMRNFVDSQDDLTHDSYEVIGSNEDCFNYQRYRLQNPQRSLSLDSRNYCCLSNDSEKENHFEEFTNGQQPKFKSVSDIYYQNSTSVSVEDLIYLPKETNPRNSDGSFYTKFLKSYSSSENDRNFATNAHSCLSPTWQTELLSKQSSRATSPLSPLSSLPASLPAPMAKSVIPKSETPHVHSISLKNVEKTATTNHYREVFKKLEPQIGPAQIERTKSDPNCCSNGMKRFGGANVRRHMLMHQKSIDLTPAESSDEDYLFKQIPSAPPLVNTSVSQFEIPDVISPSELRKNHADVTNKLNKMNMGAGIDCAAGGGGSSNSEVKVVEAIGVAETTKREVKRDILRVDMDTVEAVNLKLSQIGDDDSVSSSNKRKVSENKLKSSLPATAGVKIKRSAKKVEKRPNTAIVTKTIKSNKMKITSFSSDDESLDSDVVFGDTEAYPFESEFSPPQIRKELENILKFEQLKQSTHYQHLQQSHHQYTMSSTEIEGSPPQPRKKIDKNYLSLLYQQQYQHHLTVSDKSFSITSSEDDCNYRAEPKLYENYEETIPEENLAKLAPQTISRRDNVQLLFAHARLNLSEGSAMSELQRENTVYLDSVDGRRAKSLDAPIISVNRLPSSNAFSFKDDTVDESRTTDIFAADSNVTAAITVSPSQGTKTLRVPEVKRRRSKSEEKSLPPTLSASEKKSEKKKSKSLEKYDQSVNSGVTVTDEFGADGAKRLEKQQLLYEIAIKEKKLQKNSPAFGENESLFPKIEETVRESGGKLEILIDTYENDDVLPIKDAIIITKSPKHLDKLAKSFELTSSAKNDANMLDQGEGCTRHSKSLDESALKNDENVLLQGTSLDIWLTVTDAEKPSVVEAPKKLNGDIEILQKEKSSDFFRFGDLEEKPNFGERPLPPLPSSSSSDRKYSTSDSKGSPVTKHRNRKADASFDDVLMMREKATVDLYFKGGAAAPFDYRTSDNDETAEGDREGDEYDDEDDYDDPTTNSSPPIDYSKMLVSLESNKNPVYISRTLSRISEKSSNSEKSSDLLEDMTIVDSFHEEARDVEEEEENEDEDPSIVSLRNRIERTYSEVTSLTIASMTANNTATVTGATDTYSFVTSASSVVGPTRIDVLDTNKYPKMDVLRRQNSDDTLVNEFDLIADDIENWSLPDAPKRSRDDHSDSRSPDNFEWPSPPSSFFEVPNTTEKSDEMLTVISLKQSSLSSLSSSASTSSSSSSTPSLASVSASPSPSPSLSKPLSSTNSKIPFALIHRDDLSENSNADRNSRSEDTSLGITMTEWSSSNANTVKFVEKSNGGTTSSMSRVIRSSSNSNSNSNSHSRKKSVSSLGDFTFSDTSSVTLTAAAAAVAAVSSTQHTVSSTTAATGAGAEAGEATIVVSSSSTHRPIVIPVSAFSRSVDSKSSSSSFAHHFISDQTHVRSMGRHAISSSSFSSHKFISKTATFPLARTPTSHRKRASAFLSRNASKSSDDDSQESQESLEWQQTCDSDESLHLRHSYDPLDLQNPKGSKSKSRNNRKRKVFMGRRKSDRILASSNSNQKKNFEEGYNPDADSQSGSEFHKS